MNAINGRVAAGIAAGVVGLGGAVGVHLMLRGGSADKDAAAEQEWNAWRSELDAEFPKVGSGPGESKRPLFDDADEQRFAEFIAKHPAPDWVNVKHEDLRAISIDPFEPDPEGHDWKRLAAGSFGIAGGAAIGITGAIMLERAGSAGSTLGLALNIAGGALSLGTIAGLFLLPKGQLIDDIKSSEWNVPTSWTE